MRARLLLVGVLLSFSADLQAARGGDGDEESLRPLNSFCQLPPDRQKCSDTSSIRVFYNSQAGLCEKFVHQGCEGNKNNFATQLECLQACARRDICQLPSHSGFGDVYQSRFFYNTITKACESFLYKGHGGNANNFWDEKTCTQFCVPRGFCQLPPDRQKCSDNSSIRVFYNFQAGLCEKFVHQGCEGNKNNFATQLECLQACARRDICQLPSHSGFGDVYQFRFFYNTVTKACESFLYKGHGGNTNNFWDEETCTQFCVPRGPQKRYIRRHGPGICITQCQSDDDCGEGSFCCPTGCGFVCRRSC